jgi:hypothetical protein
VILRRFSEALKQQNWTAIAIEFVLLVLGVFLGIQVANWNAEREDRHREAEFIARLRQDFERIDARLVASSAKWQMNLASANRLLADHKAFQQHGRWPRTKSAMLFDLNNITSTSYPGPRAATYEEMLSTAQLGILRSTRLRDALRDYDTLAGRVAVLHATLQQRVEPFRPQVLAHLQFDTALSVDALLAASQSQRGPLRADYFNDVALDTLAADPATHRSLTMHASTFLDQVVVAARQRESAQAVLALLPGGDADGEGKAP